MADATATQGKATRSLTSALGRFGEQVAAYAALHQQMEVTVSGAFERARDLRAVLRARAELAAAINAARPDAREGDIVSTAVAEIFRSTIAEALSGVDSEAFFESLYTEDVVPAGFRPRVHDTYPEWATHEVPLVVLERLPVLPEEIEYRLIGQTLVLWDVDADLIVDVVPDAIPGPTS
jgi:hypothetical protein